MKPVAEKQQLQLGGAYNFRDIGGYLTEGGQRIRYGKLFRSDELSHLSPEDVAKISSLNIDTVIDYRNEKERFNNENVTIPHAKTFYLNPVADIAALAASEGHDTSRMYQGELTADLARFLMTEQNRAFVEDESCKACYREMFQIILDERNQGIVQHCRGGKDRTGFGIALIMGVLGVSRQQIMTDYLLTNTYKAEKNRHSLAAMKEQGASEDLLQAMSYMKEAHEDFLNRALDLIEDYGGFTKYVTQELHLTQGELDKLAALLLEG